MYPLTDRRIAICGYGRSGKDTAALWLSELGVLKYTHSTSFAAVEFVRQRFAEEKGVLFDSDLDCYNERFKHRKYWADKIDEMNSDDPTTLYRKCIEYQDILTGIRKKREIKACKKEGLVDIILWIDRPGIEKTDSTQEFGPEECDVIILNDVLVSFKGRLMKFAAFSDLINIKEGSKRIREHWANEDRERKC